MAADLVPDPSGEFLGADPVIQTGHPWVQDLAERLWQGAPGRLDFARAAFEWVRDDVAHALDVGDPRVTLTASEVLAERVGLCFAKSHLLAALLRACGISAGLCYQRLRDGEDFALHGLVAAQLGGRWVRLDARGNRPGLRVEFSDSGATAFETDSLAGEVDYPWVFDRPEPSVVDALLSAADTQSLCAGGLPGALEPPPWASPTHNG